MILGGFVWISWIPGGSGVPGLIFYGFHRFYVILDGFHKFLGPEVGQRGAMCGGIWAPSLDPIRSLVRSGAR